MSYKEETYIDSDGQELTKKTWNNGDTWYTNKHGLKHRLDGPAMIWSDGSEFWYLNGLLHRLDGPAIVYPDGSEYWYKYGLRHREDGPAWICCDGTVEYWLNDEKVYRKDIDLIWIKKQVCK